MTVYLDTNVFIGAKYQFDCGNFAKLRSFLADGVIKLIYSSALVGEVEQHIKTDIEHGVTQYNRAIRKDLVALSSFEQYSMCEINPDDAVNLVKKSLNDFLELTGVFKIELNAVDVNSIMNDYFQCNPPFETKKPYEFKDAIMINSVKQYQKELQETIYVVSNDKGFCKAFEGDTNFVTIYKLSELLKLISERQSEGVEQCIEDTLANDSLNDMLLKYFYDFDIDRGYYSEWECDSFKIENMDLDLSYIEKVDEIYIAYITATLYICAEITHRDEDNSYFDKEEQRYLVENFVTMNEYHRVDCNATIECSVENHGDNIYELASTTIIDERQIRTIDLDEDTLLDWEELYLDSREEPDVLYCNECGKILGFNPDCVDYYDNPICSDCAVANSRGNICPTCGRKVPYEHMVSGFCEKCFSEHD